MSELTIFIVDGNSASQEIMTKAIESVGLSTRSFSEGSSFLDVSQNNLEGCVLLEANLPDMSGLKIQKVLQNRQVSMPIIFLTTHNYLKTTFIAIERGASDFLLKPVNTILLLNVIIKTLYDNKGFQNIIH